MVRFVSVLSPSLVENRMPSLQFYLLSLASFVVGIDDEFDNPTSKTDIVQRDLFGPSTSGRSDCR
jgi:hypothetical protein